MMGSLEPDFGLGNEEVIHYSWPPPGHPPPPPSSREGLGYPAKRMNEYLRLVPSEPYNYGIDSKVTKQLDNLIS